MQCTIVLLAMTLAFTMNAEEAKTVKYIVSADNSEQPAMFFAPQSEDAVPLIVVLHTWSGNYKQNFHKSIEQWCVKNNWAYIHPNFRGANNRPEATGSQLVVADIVSAVEYAQKATKIDSASIYLLGTSGGGYTALVMAGHRPEIWAGVSAWVPISDLKRWHAQGKYIRDLEDSCGGPPGYNATVDTEYAKRSPLTYLKKARGLTLHISAGIHDGHKGSVPISHSLLAFNEVAAPKDRLSVEDIRFFVEKAEVPPTLKTDISDPTYGSKPPLFRRKSENATITIFDGGHEFIAQAAISWIQKIHKKKSNQIMPNADNGQ